ncbi:outer membrane autotransporter protein [Roseiarcus fermentans]|uniref:Outer membrane autotransporter protein n=1 Tax=Roseiarcus fermentans TaxID=1473586 RepID=A0A366F6C5_9HYPH|nr:autotransporter outer membrane beta-barrel domain-containing protein [Roseiarcus fermentans]RBP09696.1 outer membrane autotransporter protein [Roseiarcus fermentans]
MIAGSPIDCALSQALPLPAGAVLTGPVYRAPGYAKCTVPNNPYVPSVTNGANANSYICNDVYNPPNFYPSFVADAPAAMVVTSGPTQFVRVYCPQAGCSPVTAPNRSFMAEPSAIRGLTPAQIQSVLALPGLPSMITTVTAAAGSCVLTAWGAPAFGQAGGAQQFWLAGAPPTGANCNGLAFASPTIFTRQEMIGGHALWYQPLAGGGNAGAVATALDVGPYPQPFTAMDEVYKSLDLLNYVPVNGAADPGPLRAALVQLDGEIYADYPSVAIAAAQQSLAAVHTEMRATDPAPTPIHAWLSVLGGGLSLSGNGDSHTLSAWMGGFAGGLEGRVSPALVGGVAVGYESGWLGAEGISGSGSSSTVSVTPYARYAPGPWYVEGTLGYAYSWGRVNRSLSFVNAESFSSGVTFATRGSPTGNAFLSEAETGYRFDVGGGAAVTPFVGLQGIVYCGNGFVESGGGPVDLHVASATTSQWLGLLGGEVGYALPLGGAAPLQLTARVAWAYDLSDTERSASAFLDGTPSLASFTVQGASVPRNAALFSLSAVQRVAGLDLFARYEGAAGSGSYAQSATAGVRFTF